MKKLRLKSWVKKVLLISLGIAFIVISTNIYQNKIEKINNGTFVLINDNEMDK